MSEMSYGGIDTPKVRELIDTLGALDVLDDNPDEWLHKATFRQAISIATLITYMNKQEMMSDESVDDIINEMLKNG